MAAAEELCAVALDIGLHAEIVGELNGLTAEHPLRERLSELLMLALYRCGRQAEALGVYTDTRKLLIEEPRGRTWSRPVRDARPHPGGGPDTRPPGRTHPGEP